MIKFLINRPIAVFTTVLAFVSLGMICTQLIPISMLPNIDIPEISIYISNEQMEAQTLENSVVKLIRNEMLQINRLEDVESETYNGYAEVKLRFSFGTDTDYSILEVNEKIDALMQNFPSSMARPRVVRAGASDFPVFQLSVCFKDSLANNKQQLSDFCDHVIKRRIEQLPEVAIADISGLNYSMLSIVPDKEKMTAYGIQIEDITQLITANNIDLGSVLVRDGYYQYQVNFSNKLVAVEDFENLYFSLQDKRIVPLKAIAKISFAERPAQGSCFVHSKPAVSMAIIKKGDVQMQALQTAFHQLLDHFEKEYPDLDFIVTNDQTELLSFSMKNLKQSLIWGGLIAFVLMFFVMREFRSPLIIGISVPVSLVVTLLLFYLFGLTINIISLSGMILGAGMMIDNTIIVVDNIVQKRRAGHPLKMAAILGTNEVIRPLISSVLTTVSVFLPLVFLSNMAGSLFYDQVFAIAASLIISLIISVMFSPVLYVVLNKNRELPTSERENVLFRVYAYLLHRVIFPRRALFFIGFLLLVPFAFLLYQSFQVELLPKVSRSGFVISIDWNSKDLFSESEKKAVQLIGVLEKEHCTVNTFIGKQDFLSVKQFQNNGTALDMVVEGRVENVDTLKAIARQFLRENYPMAIFEIKSVKNVFEALFQTDEPQLEMHLQTIQSEVPDENQVAKMEAFLKNRQLLGAGEEIRQDELIKVSILSDKVALYHLNYNQVVSKLKTLFGTNQVIQIPNNQKMIPVIINTSNSEFDQLLAQAMILPEREGAQEIPLISVLDIRHQRVPQKILGNRNGTYFPFVINPGDCAETAMQSIKKKCWDMGDLQTSFSGTLFSNILMIKELMLVFLVSVLLLYFILAAQFESFIQPFIIISELVIDLFGVFLFLKLCGMTLNLMSAVGIIVMLGIVINDSILKVDAINKAREIGLGLQEAIFEAGKRRFNAILMTSLSTILAMLPLFFSSGIGVELQLPLAASIIGGLALGTLVSLFFVPIFYYFIYSKKANR